jgi:copper homeostasis protein
MAHLEIACFNLKSAQMAEKAGANRVELCAEISLGGTTPSREMIQQTRENLSLEFYVMIRPRGGNFVYSDEELEHMKSDITMFKELGVNGFVFGILNNDSTVNTEQNKALVALAQPFPCTFHRAFDQIVDYNKGLEDVISCGFSTLLTSGTLSNVMEGKEILRDLVVQANQRIQIMPGGGLRSTNISELNRRVKAQWYHSSAITDSSELADVEEIKKLKSRV